MSGYRGKGYRFPRQPCASCGRDVAVSIDPDGKTVWARRHVNPMTCVYCNGPRRQPRREADAPEA